MPKPFRESIHWSPTTTYQELTEGQAIVMRFKVEMFSDILIADLHTNTFKIIRTWDELFEHIQMNNTSMNRNHVKWAMTQKLPLKNGQYLLLNIKRM